MKFFNFKVFGAIFCAVNLQFLFFVLYFWWVTLQHASTTPDFRFFSGKNYINIFSFESSFRIKSNHVNQSRRCKKKKKKIQVSNRNLVVKRTSHLLIDVVVEVLVVVFVVVDGIVVVLVVVVIKLGINEVEVHAI